MVYFADDDNTYDIRLFNEIATTQRISMFPVGFIGSQGTEDIIHTVFTPFLGPDTYTEGPRSAGFIKNKKKIVKHNK